MAVRLTAEQVGNQIRYAPAGPVRTLIDAVQVTVQAALDPPVFAEAFARGQQLSPEAAFATLQTPLINLLQPVFFVDL